MKRKIWSNALFLPQQLLRNIKPVPALATNLLKFHSEENHQKPQLQSKKARPRVSTIY
jgi:hypothetical protein